MIVTNGPTTQQVERITCSGLDQHVTGWITSELAGAAKPDPAMIHLALDRYDGDPKHSWMIGDAPTDIAAARSAGIGAYWASRDRPWPSTDPQSFTAETTPEALASLLRDELRALPVDRATTP